MIPFIALEIVEDSFGFSVGDGRIRLLAWDEGTAAFSVVSGNGELIGA